MNKAQVGKLGEQLAAKYLRRHGYDILERNIHVSHEEIDFIAINKQYIAFVEVKTRVSRPENADYLSAPASAVTLKKQEHLLRAARAYLAKSSFSLQPRMDIIEVYLTPDSDLSKKDKCIEKISCIFGLPRRPALLINHIENAFGVHGYRP
jgi:putative endonuclease